jgi:hypothetical protein
VVDVAALGGHITARRVHTVTVADLNRAPGGAGEERLLDTHVEDPGGTVEHDALDVGVGEQRHHVAGRDHGAVGQLAHLREGAVARQDRDEGPGQSRPGRHRS